MHAQSVELGSPSSLRAPLCDMRVSVKLWKWSKWPYLRARDQCNGVARRRAQQPGQCLSGSPHRWARWGGSGSGDKSQHTLGPSDSRGAVGVNFRSISQYSLLGQSCLTIKAVQIADVLSRTLSRRPPTLQPRSTPGSSCALKKHAGRIHLIHLKDKKSMATAGQGKSSLFRRSRPARSRCGAHGDTLQGSIRCTEPADGLITPMRGRHGVLLSFWPRMAGGMQ